LSLAIIAELFKKCFAEIPTFYSKVGANLEGELG